MGKIEAQPSVDGVDWRDTEFIYNQKELESEVQGGKAHDVLIGGDVNKNRKMIMPDTTGHHWTHNGHSIVPRDPFTDSQGNGDRNPNAKL